MKCIITTTQMNSVVDKLSEKKPTKNKSQTKTKQGRKDLQEHRETDQLIVTEWAHAAERRRLCRRTEGHLEN